MRTAAAFSTGGLTPMLVIIWEGINGESASEEASPRSGLSSSDILLFIFRSSVLGVNPTVKRFLLQWVYSSYSRCSPAIPAFRLTEPVWRTGLDGEYRFVALQIPTLAPLELASSVSAHAGLGHFGSKPLRRAR